MLLDILIFVPTLVCILFGMRDGVVRKVVAIIVLITGLVLGQIYMRTVGDFIVGRAGINHENAPIYGFLLIFLGLLIIQGFLYRIITGCYKIGGMADKIGGIVLGFIEGILFISSLFFIFAMADFPDRQNKHDSEFYKSVVNIAPQILDMTSTVGPEVLNKLKDVGTSDPIDKVKENKVIPQSHEASTEKKNK